DYYCLIWHRNSWIF
nr:immunoglobulin light chain junction region [Macaca mulatta]